MEDKQASLILALPKGRVYEDILPFLKDSQFELTDDPSKTRKLVLDTKEKKVKILLGSGWDVPAYVTSGAAAGLLLGTAACVTGPDPGKMMKNSEIISKNTERQTKKFLLGEGTKISL